MSDEQPLTEKDPAREEGAPPTPTEVPQTSAPPTPAPTPAPTTSTSPETSTVERLESIVDKLAGIVAQTVTDTPPTRGPWYRRRIGG